MKSHVASITALAVCVATASASVITETTERHELHKREDTYQVFIRKRNAHACMMSIVFIVLFPLGAISLHLPLKGHRIVPFVHAPIQILGLAMMIGAMGLGIDIAKNDLDYFNPVKAHIVIGLLACSMIILLQPALGLLQHRHFKKHGNRSIFSHIHRWNGSVCIVLGWINSGLGFQLTTQMGLTVSTSSYVREYVFLGILGGLWFALVGVDGLRKYWWHKDKLSAHLIDWEKNFLHRKRKTAEQPFEAAG